MLKLLPSPALLSASQLHKELFFTVRVKGRAGVADDNHTLFIPISDRSCLSLPSRLEKTFRVIKSNHLEVEVQLMTWFLYFPKSTEVLMSCTLWNQLGLLSTEV